jgi:outer membrane immunogenic protein
MLRLSLLASAAVLSLSVGAQAADIPSKKAPVLAPAPVFSWAGLYVGGSVGYAHQSTRVSANTNLQGNPGSTVSGASAIAGVDIGYNLQDGSLVYGVEADVSALHASGSSFFGGKYFRKAKLTGLSTLRARVGYAFDRVLVYGTGGFALGQLKDSSGETNVSARTANISTVRAGWTLGGGIEYAYTAKWTVRAEGLYVNLGQTHATDAGNRGYGFKTTASIARVGLNYKF